jgi:hypothetical protein
MDRLLKDQAHCLAEKFTELECRLNDFNMYYGGIYSPVAQAIYDDYFHYSMEELNKLKIEILETQINKN